LNKLKELEFTGALSYEYIFYIEMEKAEGNTLKEIASEIKNKNCESFVRIIKYIDEFLKGNNIYHNDLNSGNILIKRNGGKIVKITIIDFGQSLDIANRDKRKQFNYKCNEKGVSRIKPNRF